MASRDIELSEQVTCAVCLEEFKDPRVLPCLHTYCKNCLEYLVRTSTRDGNKVVCPDCRAEIQIPGGDVSKLKVNFWVTNLLSILNLTSKDETIKATIICEMCDSNEKATGRYSVCCEFGCGFCIAAHKRVRATQQHAILSLEEVKTAGPLHTKNTSFCLKHEGELLKLFCDSCEELICRDCTIVDHRDHKYLFTGDVIDREKVAIQAQVSQATQKVERKSEV